MYLLLSLMAVTKIGGIATTIAAIAGQLVIVIIIDHFGWFNNLVIELDISRFTYILPIKGIKQGLSKKPCIAGILDSSNDVSQNVDSYKQKAPLLKMG